MSLTAAPDVSIVMPAFNAARYVEESVRSILGQTFDDLEFIAVDDGSTDDTLSILRRLAGEDRRLVVISRPRAGIVDTLNLGIATSRGQYLARMDADDVALPLRLERQVAYLRERPECVAVGTFVETIDPYGSVLDRLKHRTEHADIDRELMGGRGFAIVHPTVMMRADAVRRVGGYRKRWEHSEDLDLFLRLGEIGQLNNIPEYLLRYRMHFLSANHLRHEEQRAMKQRLMEEAYQRRGVAMAPELKFVRNHPPPRLEQTCRWGWRALRIGNRSVARQHALDALRMSPLRPSVWRLVACAARGH